MSLKKSVISLHLKSTKHAAGVDRLKSKHLRQQSIVNLFKKYDEEVHYTGERLPDNVRVYRIKVLSCFMKAGVPIA